MDSRCLPRAVPSCVTLSISAAGHTACPSMSPSKASLPVGDPSNARFLEPPEFTISHPKQHVNWFSRFCNVETVANRSTHRHPQTTPLHLCSHRPPLYSAYILHKICIYKICILTEDRDKWRKYVHGAAIPRIEDGQRTGFILCMRCGLKID